MCILCNNLAVRKARGLCNKQISMISAQILLFKALVIESYKVDFPVELIPFRSRTLYF